MPSPSESNSPVISVIVPTYRRAESLRRTLDALASGTFPTDRFEVVVVDDGGGGPVGTVVDAFRTTLDVVLLVQENSGPAGARNTGAGSARGELLAFIDDDCCPDPEWLATLERAYRSAAQHLCGGQVTNDLPGNVFAATSQLILDLIYEQVNIDREDPQFFTTNNMLVSAREFSKMKGFDERFRASEDREFCERWRKRGLSLCYVPTAVVRHAHDLDLRSFVEQHFLYGRGADAFHQLTAGNSMRDSIAFHRDPRKWLTQPFRRGVNAPFTTSVLLVVWQIVNAAGFSWNALSRRFSS